MYRFLFVVLLCLNPIVVGAQEGSSEVEKLRKEIEEQKSKLEELERKLDRLSCKAATPGQSFQSSDPAQARTGTGSDNEKEKIAPLSFRIGGAEFTPGGFVDLSSVWRSTNVGSGVATSFGAIPANDSAAGKLSEWRASTYNSRLTLTVTERPRKNVLATGYVEVDFAGAMPPNIHVTGNSIAFRMRQGWVNVQRGKFEILGGQAWTLMTPNRVGTSPAPSDIFIGLGQDSAYLAGMIFVRQSQVRATYHATPRWTLVFSAENPQQYVTNATTLPSSFISQFDTGSGNSTVANPRPDFAAKLAYDAKPGKRALHFEVAGLSRQFRTLTSNNVQHSAQGLGGSAALVIEPVQNLRWILTSFFSSGGGRYIMGMGPDVIVGSDGSISPVHLTSGIAGLEYQIRPSSQVYAYHSGVYFSRNYMRTPSGDYLGFGYPGASTSANRQIQEATVGYAHTFWKNPNYGAFQALGQYAYVTRSAWHSPSTGNSDMHTHMVFAGMRMTLP